MEDTTFVFSLANFLMNDAEQGNNVNPTSVRIDTLPNNGSLYLNGVLVAAGTDLGAAAITAGPVEFVPTSNANGNNYANFSFSVKDASGLFDPAPNTITVNVAAVNDGAPLAGNDNFLTTLGTPIVLDGRATAVQRHAARPCAHHRRRGGLQRHAGGQRQRHLHLDAERRRQRHLHLHADRRRRPDQRRHRAHAPAAVTTWPP